MKRSGISTTTAFRDLLRLGVQGSLWLLLLLLLNEGLFYGLTHVYPGKGDYQLEVEKAGFRYERLFLGASRTHRGVNTPLFDSLQGSKKSSFNLADVRMTLLDQFIVMENVLAMGGKPHTIIFELVPVHADNSNQPLLLQEASLPLFQVSHAFPLKDQLDFLGNVISKRFSLLLKLNLQSVMVDRYTSQQGFDAFSSFAYDGSHHKTPIQPLYDRPVTAEQFHMTRITMTVIQQLIVRCQQQGVRPLFLLPVQMTPDEQYILGTVWPSIPAACRWDVREHAGWNTLRADSCWEDQIHLSLSGAKVYTTILSETYPATTMPTNKDSDSIKNASSAQ